MKAVSDVLPHRPPFLFVERCLELTDESATCEGTFAPIEGHFPGEPLVPGVHLLEGMAQTLAYWALARGVGAQILLGGADKVRFREKVAPGELVRFEVAVDRVLMDVVHARGVAKTGGREVASAVLKARV